MALQAIPPAIRSGERNIELLLLGASVAFLALAWRALDAAAFPMPAGSGRILTQFLVVGLAGHVGLRIVVPRASGLPYAIVLLLVAIGLAFVTRLVPGVAQDQADWMTLGVALMVVSAALSRRYRLLRRYKYTAAFVAVGLLVLTGFFGTTINGARLWFEFAGHTVQTTELIKLFFVIFLAGYLADEGAILSMPRLRFAGRSYSALPYLAPMLLTLAAAIAVLALLRDLGSIGLLLLLSVSSLYVATGRARYLLAGIALLALTAVIGYYAFGHARERIDIWFDPYDQSQGAGYQTVQSLYAIEAGGVTGEGLGLGEPDVIPASPTDYIFSAIAEELGLAGALGVVLLFVLLFFSGLRIALDVPDGYGRLLAICIALLITIQAAVIISGNLRLIPTTGITLPFVSYGGSSLIVNFVLVGMLLGISDRSASQG